MDYFSKIVSSINSEIDTTPDNTFHNNTHRADTRYDNTIHNINTVVSPLSPQVQLRKRFSFETNNSRNEKPLKQRSSTLDKHCKRPKNDIKCHTPGNIIYTNKDGIICEKKTQDSLCFHNSSFKEIYEQRFGKDILTFDTYNSDSILHNMEDAWMYNQLKNMYNGKRRRM